MDSNEYRAEWVPLAALLLLGSVAFIRLMGLPVFEDEASQIRWMVRAIEAGEWLQPFRDGKPLEAWPMVPFVWLGLPPLLVSRTMHVLSGLLTVALTYRLALELGDRAAAFVCGALAAVCPFFVYMERLSLCDVFLCTGCTWVLLSVVRFIRAPIGAHAIEFACSLVVAAFCKFPMGFLAVLAMPLALFLMPAHALQAMLRPPVRAKLLLAHAPAAVLLLAVVSIACIRLRLGLRPGFGLQHMVGIGLGQYTDIAKSLGFTPPSLATELSAQLSWPVILIGAIGLAASAMSDDWRRRWLVAAGLAPLAAIGLLASFWFSRYLLFTLPPLVVAAVSGWRSLSLRGGRFRRPAEWSAFAICAILMCRQSALIILDPIAAKWSPLDRFQYFEGWTSGYGYPEAAQLLLRMPEAPAMIYSLDGHSAYQLLTYLPAGWRDRVKPVLYARDGTELRSADARFENLCSRLPAWIIAPRNFLADYLDSSIGPMNSQKIDLLPIALFDKPGSRAQLGVYEVRWRTP